MKGQEKNVDCISDAMYDSDEVLPDVLVEKVIVTLLRCLAKITNESTCEFARKDLYDDRIYSQSKGLCSIMPLALKCFSFTVLQ